MAHSRHKRKNSKVLIVTSDAVDAGIRQYRIHPKVLRLIVYAVCILIGALAGCYAYEWNVVARRHEDTLAERDAVSVVKREKAELEAEILTLNEEIAGLNGQITNLNEQIMILSRTVAQKTQSESELARELEKQTLPTGFPLTGKANLEEHSEGEPICIFTGTAGSMVVSTAKGTVIVANDDAEYGHNVWVDHGNGYVTIYRNQGDVKVKQGEAVSPGTTIFLIDEGNTRLGYQMMKDGGYINPMDMLSING